MITHPIRRRHAFTLIELIVIIVVLAILSGVAIPKYIDYTANAKASAAKATLGAVRSSLANMYANSALTGAPAYPTLTELQTVGTVMQEALPPNPYNNDATIVAATWATTPPVSGANGYNYDSTAGRFWLNSTTSGINEHLW
jgi:general secretion pathway protein G